MNLGKQLGRPPPESIVRAGKKQDDHAVASAGSGARNGSRPVMELRGWWITGYRRVGGGGATDR